MVEEAQIVVHKADQPDFLIDFAHANRLPCKGLAEVDLPLSDADTAASGDDDGAGGDCGGGGGDGLLPGAAAGVDSELLPGLLALADSRFQDCGSFDPDCVRRLSRERVEVRGFPPIQQKALNGWGTRQRRIQGFYQ